MDLKNTELNGFDFLLDVDIIIVFTMFVAAIVLAYCLFKVNNSEIGDEMETFIKNGGDKSDDASFERFRKGRKFRKNLLISIAFFVLVAEYINYVADLF